MKLKARYGTDVKSEVCRRYLDGELITEIAASIGINVKTARNWVYRLPKQKTTKRPGEENPAITPAPYRRGYRWGAGF